VTTNDVTAFVNAFAEGAPEADLNHDQAITSPDAVAFFTAYNCACANP